MAPLKALLALAVSLSTPAAAAPDPIGRWSAEIAAASSRFAVPEQWIRRVMRLESGGRARILGQPVVSRAGAMGLMQLMPSTWAEMRARLGLGADPFDPADNIAAGAAYLRQMYDRFGYPGLFAAYNAGPRRYGEWLSGRRGLPSETRSYVAAAIRGNRAAASPGERPHGPTAMFAIAPPGTAGVAALDGARAAPAGLFVRLDAMRDPGGG